MYDYALHINASLELSLFIHYSKFFVLMCAIINIKLELLCVSTMNECLHIFRRNDIKQCARFYDCDSSQSNGHYDLQCKLNRFSILKMAPLQHFSFHFNISFRKKFLLKFILFAGMKNHQKPKYHTLKGSKTLS